MSKIPKISLCMIVRDDADVLDDCLSSVQGAVDEIVVVDTGSIDESVSIAKSHGARIVHHPWQDDFSDARNASLSAAKGDWVLVLDADERIAKGGVERIRNAALDDGASGFFLKFENPMSESESLRFKIVRLFRRTDEVSFQYVIHEQVTPSLDRVFRPQGKTLKFLDVTVMHFGYAPARMASKGKEERNIRLFEKQISLFPRDPYGFYKFGDFLRMTSQKDRALGMLKRAFEILIDTGVEEAVRVPYAGELVALLALELNDRGATEEAYALLLDTDGIFKETGNRSYIRAGLALKLHKWEEAEEAYKACLSVQSEDFPTAQRDGISSFLSWTGLGTSAMGRGFWESAEEAFSKALLCDPRYVPAILGQAQSRQKRGDPKGAMHALSTFDSQGFPQVDTLTLARVAALALRSGDVEFALRRVATLRERKGDDSSLHRLEGACCLVKHNLEGAKAHFALSPNDLECRLGLHIVECLKRGQHLIFINHEALRPLCDAFQDIAKAHGISLRFELRAATIVV